MKQSDTLQPVFMRCEATQFDAVFAMYENCVRELQRTVNYPKWTTEHPSREYVAQAIQNGELFACIQNGEILGAVVLNENPEGDYTRGNWRVALSDGEFLVLHILATAPQHARCGIGSLLVEGCADYAKKNAYRALRLDIVPDNIPAKNLYTSHGFTGAGIADLQRHIDEIPLFELYEYNL